MNITFPGESPQYRAARDRLLERELELRRAMEAVAAARRELPAGGVVPEDYVFQGTSASGAASTANGRAAIWPTTRTAVTTQASVGNPRLFLFIRLS